MCRHGAKVLSNSLEPERWNPGPFGAPQLEAVNRKPIRTNYKLGEMQWKKKYRLRRVCILGGMTQFDGGVVRKGLSEELIFKDQLY